MNISFMVGTEEIRLTADDKNYELRKLKIRKDKTGNPVEEWQPYLFLSSLESALSRILSLKISASDAISLKQLKADVEKARVEFMAAWKTI